MTAGLGQTHPVQLRQAYLDYAAPKRRCRAFQSFSGARRRATSTSMCRPDCRKTVDDKTHQYQSEASHSLGSL